MQTIKFVHYDDGEKFQDHLIKAFTLEITSRPKKVTLTVHVPQLLRTKPWLDCRTPGNQAGTLATTLHKLLGLWYVTFS